MDQIGASFIVSGEVVGQRPMSQSGLTWMSFRFTVIWTIYYFAPYRPSCSNRQSRNAKVGSTVSSF